MKNIKIGLLGCGTVGTGVVRVLKENKELIKKKTGSDIVIGKILVKNTDKNRDAILDDVTFTTNPLEVINDPDINIIVEVMGGIGETKEYLLQALLQGKSIVTANKDLMALHGGELLEAAKEGKADLRFEASVAGGIPIIGPLKESLAANRIDKIMGIINGTTNFILSKMSKDGSDFQDTLKEAQELGYAEADPTADIEGLDAARKIAILASIGFNSRVTLDDVYVEGITKITANDISYAKELGYEIKLLGIAEEANDYLQVKVHPVFIKKNHPLANVDDAYNAIFVSGNAVGNTMFYGKGAGELPTASAVVGDIISIVKNIKMGCNGSDYCTCFDNKKIGQMRDTINKFYLRMTVVDKPGVMANIATVFGNQEVSLESIIQKRLDEGNAQIVLITHDVKEGNLQDALRIIEGLSCVANINNVIRVEED